MTKEEKLRIDNWEKFYARIDSSTSQTKAIIKVLGDEDLENKIREYEEEK